MESLKTSLLFFFFLLFLLVSYSNMLLSAFQLRNVPHKNVNILSIQMELLDLAHTPTSS